VIVGVVVFVSIGDYFVINIYMFAVSAVKQS
jgi:hypothetical protein